MPIVSTTTDGDYLIEHWKNGKVTRRPRDEVIVQLYVGGLAEIQIANRFGIGRGVIRRVLQAHGVHVRTQSEAELLKWSKMDLEQRLLQVRAANDACRGRTHSLSEKVQRAKTRQADPTVNVSRHELRLKAMLRSRGFVVEQQTAVGPYNCDLAVGRVAVEVWGGQWHFGGRHFARFPERTRYILDAGYDLIILVVTERFPLTPTVADHVAALIERLRRKPPEVREYRVVWGAGEFSTGGRADDDEITLVVPFTCRRNPANGQYETVAR